ncbi:hypothetical protein KCTC32516_01723 [Polaribacter huanghezhanensis]|uniref:hypothetical protein n=1 Tax=Polaribacter huanghezhanensis TaxID=1354726 RepID=UPI002647854D|nr:hypothetical protein [Polaribacter huanghezhanensis]WKD86348.1 hypothetical protein KCTC32516_01723 [Polaribacter huanghezhanensis]
MKKNILILIFTTISTISFSQITTLALKDFDTKINTIGNKSIEVNLFFDFPNKYKEYIIDEGSINNVNSYLVIGNKKNKLNESPINKGLKFTLTIEAEKLAERLENINLEHQVQIEKDLIFEIWENKKENTRIKITITNDQITKWTHNVFNKLSKAQKEALIKEKGGEAIISENSIDLGYIPESESVSGKTEVSINFKYQNYWKNSDLGYSFEGLVGTDSKDSLNFVSVYPIITSLRKSSTKIRDFDFIGKIGFEGNQTFTSWRVSADISLQGIIPNLIDLTAGENRLRLKPVINIGLKFYNEVKNNRKINTDNEISNQAYADFYYYIPIHKTFSLTLNGKVFYDFSAKVNPNKDVNYNFDAVLGMNVAKGVKTVFKYTKGNNNITFEKGDYFSIGVLSDILGGMNK